MSKKMKIIVIVACALFLLTPVVFIFGPVYFTQVMNAKVDQQTRIFEQHKAELEAKMKEKGGVVCASKNLSPGQLIKKEDLSERQMQVADIPPEAVTSLSSTVGMRTRSTIAKGQMLTQQDIMFDRGHAPSK